MHHAYSSKKGDPLCPLGFHPQVRWPTRCKRCFRDYKEHGDRKGSLTDIASSSPSLASWNAPPASLSASGRSTDNGDYGKRNWASATNLAGKDEYGKRGYEKENTAPISTSLLDLSSHAKDEQSGRASHPQKLQIKGVINSSSVGNSENDVAFIIQVRKSRQTSDKPENSSVQNDRDNQSDREKEGHKKDAEDKSEIAKLKSMLSDMKARCEKAEKEKNEILLRRLASMDTISSKTSANEAIKLQKLTKELQAKNEALSDEKARLLTKMKNLEEEANGKFHRGERDKVSNELRSKLRAAETLCESLMDENEDMKREIRELEEEIYELQDNFREEQADEYTSLRKSLEQSNKNCRILSFKLRKVERRAETLEGERADFKRKCDEMSGLEETIKKIRRDYEAKSQQRKGSDLMTKVQLKKILDDFNKELGDALTGVDGGKGTKDVDNRDIRTDGANYEKLSREHEQLKEKLENTMNELEKEKRREKIGRGADDEDKKSKELISLRKKLEEAVSLRDAERQDWQKEKTNHYEEKEKLKSKLLSLSAEKLKVYNEVLQLNKDLEAAKASEKERGKMEKKTSELREELSAERQRIKKLQEELSSSEEREKGMKEKLTTLERAKSKLESSIEGTLRELENLKTSTDEKISEANGELTKARKEKEKLKLQIEKEKKLRETEVTGLKKKITALERTDQNSRRIDEVKQSYNEKIQELESEMKVAKEKKESLARELDEMKAARERIEKEVETLRSELSAEKKKTNGAETGQRNAEALLRSKEEEWRSERSALEERILARDAAAADKRVINEANDKIDNLTRENKHLFEQLEEARRLHEDLTNKLKDYDAVSKVQSSMSADTSALETEIKKLKTTSVEAEKTRKTDLAQCKLRYEHRITAINDELQAIQNQLSRHKRERDTYKHMLEGAQKTIAEFKSVKRKQIQQTAVPGGHSSALEKEEDDSRTYVPILEKQISCMEDELSETRLEASTAKAELVSEKSAAHIKLSEMQSRINELEEERMLNNRRSKIPGLKVRMELAWQKEREEHQRLLQETATLARDLRQTLFEIERERVNERVEYKRKHDQLKKVLDEEKEEKKKKLVELQCDLLELRDAHAKLRTSNEKMRREKERHEKEREELKGVIIRRNKLEQSEMRNVDALLQLVENLLKLFPEVARENGNDGPDDYTPTPPRRLRGPKSRESSPMIDAKEIARGSNSMLEDRTEKLKNTVDRLREVARELEESKKGLDDARMSRLKKFGKRSTSVETSEPGKVIVSTHSKTRLKRKSISLEQTTGRHEESPFIWSTHSNVSSMQSLEGSETGSQTFSLQRDSSVDSRLSGGSTKSEMLPREKRYGKGIIRKLTTKLTKSASFDDPQGPIGYGYQSSGSEVSVSDAPVGSRTEKKNLKKKLTDMFKRGSKTGSTTPTTTSTATGGRSERRCVTDACPE